VLTISKLLFIATKAKQFREKFDKLEIIIAIITQQGGKMQTGNLLYGLPACKAFQFSFKNFFSAIIIGAPIQSISELFFG
jgi:hypothetical protein